MITSDVKFLRLKDRATMRVILAAEMSRLGCDKTLVMTMSDLVEEEAGDVYVEDGPAERIILKLTDHPDFCFLFIKGGYVRVAPPVHIH